MRYSKRWNIAAVLVLAVSAAFAQTTPPTSAPTPAQLAPNLVARLKVLLDLTSAQQTSATTIFSAEFTSLASTKTSLQTAQSTLTTDIENNDTSGISTEAAAIGTLVGQVVEAKANADAAFYALLTPTQQTKFTSLKGFGLLGGLGGLTGFGNHSGGMRH